MCQCRRQKNKWHIITKIIWIQYAKINALLDHLDQCCLVRRHWQHITSLKNCWILHWFKKLNFLFYIVRKVLINKTVAWHELQNES